MFTLTYRAIPTNKGYCTHRTMRLKFPDLKTLDIVTPSIGINNIISFSNDGCKCEGYCDCNNKPIFEYDPWHQKVRVFIYNQACGDLETIYEYNKNITCGGFTQLTSEYLWKKLFIPFSYKKDIFILDRKKLKRKKIIKCSILDWCNKIYNY